MGNLSSCRIFFTGILFFAGLFSGSSQQLTRSELIEDAREMLDIVETCHPDPYLHTGGKIALYDDFYNMLGKIPEEGMDVKEFWWLLSGFLANIADGHTYLFPVEQPDYANPGGIPIRFLPLADSSLVVERVARPEHKTYIGCRVLKINGYSIADLMESLGSLYPMENTFDHFRNLEVYLWYSTYMTKLFPDWVPGDWIVVEVLDKDGKIQTFEVATGKDVKYKTAGISDSPLKLPDTGKCDFVFDWLGEKGSIAYIRIDKQDEFREYAEEAVSGLAAMDPATKNAYRGQYLKYAHTWYQRYHGEEGPDSLELLISGLPSFTEFMIKVTKSLKEHKSENLIIDLRDNQGGVSLLSDILIYFLYGKSELYRVSNDNYSITYLSEPAVRIVPSFNLEELNRSFLEENSFEIETGDYDFSLLKDWQINRNPEVSEIPASNYKNSKTFYEEYISGEHSAFYTPGNIFVLGSHKTFSAGYETLVRLIKGGATFAGVPPSQPGNCYGMGISPVQGLKNSKIRLNVSVKRVVTFPEDENKGWQLDPDIPLTYTKYSQYGYDKNATVSLVLELIKGATH